jgi:phosphomannomutase/phosphoglucomutase
VAANLALLREAVLADEADIGVAYDGDADRVTFVDEGGCPVPTDKVIVTFAQLALAGGAETIVYDQKCSRVVPDAVRAAGGRAVMERSGHTFIKTTFLALGAAYAGEVSGHHFFREIGGDDGLVASLIYARHLRASGGPLSALVRAIPSYPITPDIRLPMPAPEIQRLMGELEHNLSGEAEVRKTDGIRLAFEDGWALVRPSVTEPVVSLRFEGVDAASLERIVARVTAATGLLARGQIPLGAGDSGCGW